jgi:hypothetical protein
MTRIVTPDGRPDHIIFGDFFADPHELDNAVVIRGQHYWRMVPISKREARRLQEAKAAAKQGST